MGRKLWLAPAEISEITCVVVAGPSCDSMRRVQETTSESTIQGSGVLTLIFLVDTLTTTIVDAPLKHARSRSNVESGDPRRK